MNEIKSVRTYFPRKREGDMGVFRVRVHYFILSFGQDEYRY